MADAVTSNVMHDSSRRLVIHITGVSDGTGEADVVKLDASAYGVDGFVLKKVTGASANRDVILEADATTDVPLVVIPADTDVCLCWDDYSGPSTKWVGTGGTGDLTLTVAAGTAGDTYALTIEAVKLT